MACSLIHYGTNTSSVAFPKLLRAYIAIDQLLSLPVLKRPFVYLHVGPAQLLYIPSEIALARLAHPLAAAGLRRDFCYWQKCSARCDRMRGMRGNILGRVSLARDFLVELDHAGTASGIAAAADKARLLLLLMLSVVGEEGARHTHTPVDGPHFTHDKI